MEHRVLIWASGRDGALTSRFLTDAGFEARDTATCAECCRELEAGAGVLVIAEELLSDPQSGSVREVLGRQPPWSDIPVIVIAGEQARSRPGLFSGLSSVAVLHRPLSLDTLYSTVSAALRARRRQYEVRDLLKQREEANRRRDEFLAMMAHELRNPLAPIRTGLQLLRATDSAEQAARVRAMMERQVANLARLIDDLLDVSRMTRGQIPLKKQVIDVLDLLRHTVEARTREAAEKGLHLTVESFELQERLRVEADPTRLEQMIDNLLVNAIKYTPANGSIRASLRREAEEVVIAVKDTGRGIPPHMLSAVFELFTQADRELDRTQGGLGIGLTVVKTLAELHGGTVAAFSEGVGKGTEVAIRLPATQKVIAREPRAARSREHASGPGRRVLIIEDNRDGAETLAGFLRERGHTVSVAYSGDDGLAAFERERPDAVICDIGLPGMDGYHVAKAIRERDCSGKCLLIAVTGYGDHRERKRGLEAGFQHYFIKPADPDQIAGLLEPDGSSPRLETGS